MSIMGPVRRAAKVTKGAATTVRGRITHKGPVFDYQVFNTEYGLVFAVNDHMDYDTMVALFHRFRPNGDMSGLHTGYARYNVATRAFELSEKGVPGAFPVNLIPLE